jgi:hypothetical protein
VSETLRSILGDESCELRDLPSRLVYHALRILSEVHDERSYAPRLLAADALISYAMEAATGDCGGFDAFAAGTAQAIAALQK